MNTKPAIITSTKPAVGDIQRGLWNRRPPVIGERLCVINDFSKQIVAVASVISVDGEYYDVEVVELVKHL